jgi:hypothetical protein
MLCIVALSFCEVYWMLGSMLSCTWHRHWTMSSMWITVVSHLRLYVIVTVCCQSRRDCSEVKSCTMRSAPVALQLQS